VIEDCDFDTSPSSYAGYINTLIRSNNNFALHNNQFIVQDPGQRSHPCIGQIYIGNTTNQAITTDLIFAEPPISKMRGLVKECEITVTFDNAGMQYFTSLMMQMNSNFEVNGSVEIINDTTLLLLSDSVIFRNVPYPPNTTFPILMEFNFIGSDNYGKQFNFDYDVVETIHDTSGISLYSGMHFHLERPMFSFFKAIPSAIVAPNGKDVILSAIPQNGNLDYNWYDINDSLVGTGTTITTTPPAQIASYRLELLSQDFCIRDVAHVISSMIPQNAITNISPNPTTTGIVTIDYQLAPSISTGELWFYNQTGVLIGISSLNIYANQIIVDISKQPAGTYTVELRGNGVAYDSDNFVKW
jgi:hypothetical protein